MRLKESENDNESNAIVIYLNVKNVVDRFGNGRTGLMNHLLLEVTATEAEAVPTSSLCSCCNGVVSFCHFI